jgi:hypothetical protein
MGGERLGAAALSTRTLRSRAPWCFLPLYVAIVFLSACGGSHNEPTAPSLGKAGEVQARPTVILTDGLPGQKFLSNGNDHVAAATDKHGAYFSNPPTSGWHLPALNRPGVYTQLLPPEAVAHFLEHAGVWVLYTCPSGCEEVVQGLQRIVTAEVARGRPVALAPYAAREQPKQRINLVAWQYLLALDEFDETAVTQFIAAHACRYNPEGGPFCDGIRGSTDAAADAGDQGFNAQR